MTAKKADKTEPLDPPTEGVLLLRAIIGIQRQLDGATPTEREAAKAQTHAAVKELVARLGASYTP